MLVTEFAPRKSATTRPRKIDERRTRSARCARRAIALGLREGADVELGVASGGQLIVRSSYPFSGRGAT